MDTNIPLVLRCIVDNAGAQATQEHAKALESLGVSVARLTHREITYDVPMGNLEGFNKIFPVFIIESVLEQKTKKVVEHLEPKYAFCESVTVSGAAPWHIRELDDKGPKLGGGITTPSLCGRVRPTNDIANGVRGLGGWDLNVKITEHHLSHACVLCVQVYRFRAKQAAPYPDIGTPVKTKSKVARIMERFLGAGKRKARVKS
jgi:hypothetical protein